ncbi:phosphoenolpyruvate synthase [Klebsiella pneumoniae]|uniref:Phosphoenolpyruvate synthase n=1 Tax=Klebsiella pneumoniae TaxID=573 RepID=A0A4P0Y8W5_KLEPN|nr:phosphoenolpyruvate synthase [Klebsiella pneumoniae]
MVFITSAWGLGEMVVQGAVNPDEFYVHKPTWPLAVGDRAPHHGSKKIRMVYAPTQEHGKQVRIEDVPQAQRDIFSLSNEEVQELAKQAVQIEKHYGRPMDIEWAKDGHTGKLFIVQARPETVRSRGQVEWSVITLHAQGQIIAEGRAIGHRIGAGPVKVIHDISEMNRIEPGDVLVTDMTDPDWEPIMKKASAIVTNRAGVPVTRRLSPVSWGSRRWSAAAMLPIAFRKIRMSPSPAPKATPAMSTPSCSTSASRAPASATCRICR